jgi:cytolysin (calcineurin-like family phosphatase)
MKTKKLVFSCLLFILSASFFSCASGGVFNESNMTDVKLGDANYNIVATDVGGESSAAYILGATLSNGMNTSIYAVARVSGTAKLYSDALKNLWKNAEKKLGTIEGKKYALVNVRYDANALNLFFYTSVTITVRADIIEFVIP